MTREEAIKVLQNEVNCAQNDRCSLSCDSCEFFVTDDQVQTAHETAISALQQQGNKRNEPLTLDELREMDGEPVWVEHYNGGEWVVVHWNIYGRITTAYNAELRYDEYGERWTAYRQKTEEDHHDSD